MQLFLNAKHWQIAAMQLIPILCIFFFRDTFSPLQLGIMWILLISVSVFWLYSVGSAANRQLDVSLQKNEMIFFVTALASIFIVIVVLFIMHRSFQLQTRPPGWLVHLLFAGLGCFGYTIWFAASQFVAAEKKGETFYIEYAFPMLGLWFGFAGAWFLQPRINQVLGKKPE